MKTLKLALLGLISILMASSIQSMEEEYSKKRKRTDNPSLSNKRPRKEEQNEQTLKDKIKKKRQKLAILMRKLEESNNQVSENLGEATIEQEISIFESESLDKDTNSTIPLSEFPIELLAHIFIYGITPEPVTSFKQVPALVEHLYKNIESFTSVCRNFSGSREFLKSYAKQYLNDNNILAMTLETYYENEESEYSILSLPDSKYFEIALSKLITAGIDYNKPLNIKTIQNVPLTDLIALYNVGGESALMTLTQKMHRNNDIDIQDNNGNTLFMRLLLADIIPLEFTQLQNPRIFLKPKHPKLMLNHGPLNMGLQNNDGNNAIMLCVSQRNKAWPILSDILHFNKSFDINAKNNRGDTPLLILMKYAKNKNFLTDCLSHLFSNPSNEIDLNIQDKDGNTAIMLLVKYGHADFETIFNFMVKKGAKLNIFNKEKKNIIKLTRNYARLAIIYAALAQSSTEESEE